MHTQFEPKSRLEADLSPSRATATILNAAPDAQNSYTQANQHSGGGRTEEKRDRVNQQQIDRSGISNRTRARGTEIEAGTTSAYGWTAFPAERQGAAIEMRVGQNGGPLPFEAITDFGEPIVYFLYFLHGLQEGRFLQQSQGYSGRESQFEAFLATAFTQRGTAEEADAMGGGAERSCGWDEQCAGRSKSNPPRPYAFEQEGYGRARLRWRRRGTR
jgi:hypothetical protein